MTPLPRSSPGCHRSLQIMAFLLICTCTKLRVPIVEIGGLLERCWSCKCMSPCKEKAQKGDFHSSFRSPGIQHGYLLLGIQLHIRCLFKMTQDPCTHPGLTCMFCKRSLKKHPCTQKEVLPVIYGCVKPPTQSGTSTIVGTHKGALGVPVVLQELIARPRVEEPLGLQLWRNQDFTDVSWRSSILWSVWRRKLWMEFRV